MDRPDEFGRHGQFRQQKRGADNMELKDFVAQSLLEILQGIREAQLTDGGDKIAANMAGTDGGGNLINVGRYGLFTRVDFDVAISAETGGSGGGNLMVFGLGIEGRAARTTGTANRLTFSVPIRLPQGDQELAKQVDKQTAEAATIDYLTPGFKRI